MPVHTHKYINTTHTNIYITNTCAYKRTPIHTHNTMLYYTTNIILQTDMHTHIANTYTQHTYEYASQTI